MNVPARGGTALRAHIGAFLAQAMPPLIDAARTAWAMSEYQLPYPKMYDAIDPSMVGNDSYPALGAVLLNDRNHIREDWDIHAQQVYSPVYSIRLFVSARTPLTEAEIWEEPQKASAVRVRDDLTRLIQQALLQTPSLGRPSELKLDEASLQTDYLEPVLTRSQGGRWVASSMVSVEIAFTESTYAPAIGTANTTLITAQPLNP